MPTAADCAAYARAAQLTRENAKDTDNYRCDGNRPPCDRFRFGSQAERAVSVSFHAAATGIHWIHPSSFPICYPRAVATLPLQSHFGLLITIILF